MARKRQGPELICLIPGRQVPFRRAIRDKRGHVVKVYRFEPESPLEVDAEGVAVVRRDIGRTVCICRPSKEGDRFLIDWDATNKIHIHCYGTACPSHARRSINVGAAAEKSRVVDPAEKKPNPADAEGGDEDPEGDGDDGQDDQEDGDEIELSDELVDLIEKNRKHFPEMSPEGIKKFLVGGGKLEDLDGFDEAKAKELKESLGIE